MRTTRDIDFEKMEEFRDSHRNKFTKKAVERVWKQTRNDDLEKLRRLLIEAHKRHDLNEVAKLERMVWQIQQRLERR